jgi:hypothetical protein
MALDDGPELIGANLKPCSLDLFRDNVLASEFEAWAYIFSVHSKNVKKNILKRMESCNQVLPCINWSAALDTKTATRNFSCDTPTVWISVTS